MLYSFIEQIFSTLNTLNWKPTFKEKKMSKVFSIIFGCLIIFIATTFGSALIYFMKKDINKKINSIISGFSAGIMISASIFSLILPSISYAENFGKWDFVPAVIGILAGSFLILLIDIIMKIMNKKNQDASIESLKLKRFVFAVTLHNIPEAMAVGFAIGSALNTGSSTALMGALGLAVGIAIQNIPEGLAVALPVYNHTKNKNKSFFIGTMSGLVEPIFAFISILIASTIQVLLPWFLAFSAGAMLFVSVEDLIPEAKYGESSHAGTWGFIIGFVLMMILDITLG